jgi:septum formation protein
MHISKAKPLVLGSASPRRREILAGLAIPIRVLVAHPSEDLLPGETASDYLDRIVGAKLLAVAEILDAEPCAGVLVADTIVVLDGEVLGKPADQAEAERLLRRLVGRTHTVYTRYAIARAQAPAAPVRARTVASLVSMRSAREPEIVRYAATGEGLDKAGAYAAQGIGAFLVERIEGSYSNVVGLPACEVVVDLQDAGLLAQYP